ncbi:unnamed protein product, partial [Linum tenue]
REGEEKWRKAGKGVFGIGFWATYFCDLWCRALALPHRWFYLAEWTGRRRRREGKRGKGKGKGWVSVSVTV